MTVSTDVIVVGTIKKPNGHAVPPYQAEEIDTLQIKDKKLGTLFILMTEEEWLAAADATQITGGGGSQDLQSVTDIGSTTTNRMQFYAEGGTVIDIDPNEGSPDFSVQTPDSASSFYIQVGPELGGYTTLNLFPSFAGGVQLRTEAGQFTGSRIQNFQDADGTIALTSDIEVTNPLSEDLGANNFRITQLATPVSMQDAANKAYVDTFVQGLSPKTAVRVATTAQLTGVYNSAAIIAITATGVLTIDGVALVLNDRVIVKDGVSTGGTQANGIYYVSTAGALGIAAILTRSTDADTGSELVSAYVITGSEGSTNASKGYVQSTPSPITIGSTAIVWNLFNNNTVSPGTGIRISANTIYSRLSEGFSGGQAVKGGTQADDTLTVRGSISTDPRTTNDPAVIIDSAGSLGDDNTAQVHLSIPVTVAQSSTAGYTAVKVSVTESSTGSGAKYLMNLLVGATSKFSVSNTGAISISDTTTYAEGANVAVGTGTGTKIGTATTQKIGFWNATPIVQPSGNLLVAIAASGLVAAPTILNSDVAAQTIRDITAATDNFVIGDANQVVTGTRATGQTFTIPTNASVPFSIGAIIEVIQLGDGKVTIAGPGVTIVSVGSLKSIANKNGAITMRKLATDTWILMGALIA